MNLPVSIALGNIPIICINNIIISCGVLIVLNNVLFQYVIYCSVQIMEHLDYLD